MLITFALCARVGLSIAVSCTNLPQHDRGATPVLADILRAGPWRAWVLTPGGELPFALELTPRSEGWSATIINASERIEIPTVERSTATDSPGQLRLEFPHYDSVITAVIASDGEGMQGTWRKRRSLESWQELPFAARWGAEPRFGSDVLLSAPDSALPARLAEEFAAAVQRANGRFALRFANQADPAIGIFEVRANGTASGTILTTTGDYRYLAGQLDRAFAGDDGLVGCNDDGQDHHFLRLSCFDGAHAFLFVAEVLPNAELRGGFWSGGSHYEGWTATRSATARMPDAFGLTQVVAGQSLDGLEFPQVFPIPPQVDSVTGERVPYPKVALSSAGSRSKLRLIQIFGSWCPNCQDACAELHVLQERYRDQGLTILSLAFELTGALERDAQQVQRYAQRHHIDWPILLAGTADKANATRTLKVLDQLRAYPTTLFVDARNRVRYVYTGFFGPATGDAHEEQRQLFVRVIESLLNED